MPILKGLGNLLKEKPDVPKAPFVDPQAEQEKALRGNLENFSLISKLAERSNDLGLNQSLQNIDAILGSGAKEQIAANIRAGLSGELPDDVVDTVRRNAAERATAGGFGGSQAAANLTARDLGLTSLQLTQDTLSSAGRWLAQVEAGTPRMNFSGMFISPAQSLAQANVNETNRFQRQLFSNQLDAAFSAQTIAGNTLGDIDDFITELTTSFAGSLGGGGV